MIAVLDAVDNLRSLISRNAINLVGEIFTYMNKTIETEMENIVSQNFSDSGRLRV